MHIDHNTLIRIHCKRGTCKGIYEGYPSEILRVTNFTPRCPSCRSEFSEGRTINIQSELVRAFCTMLKAVASWRASTNFEIELIQFDPNQGLSGVESELPS